MHKGEIENLRKKLDLMIISDVNNGEELLEISREMDILIVEYQKEQMELWLAAKLKAVK